jgi:para-nitrobenzyl esterase
MSPLLLRIALLAVLPVLSATAQDHNLLVSIATGKISGAVGRNPEIRVFKGIPYAKPPVDNLRWKPPQPPAAWSGVRPATEFGHACMQLPYPETSLYYSPPKPMSEDCLYLNVWTGAKSTTERRPVMVWIHGGAFTRGSGATPTYDGEHLASKGVVVVTINYRLGIFGFLAHPDLTSERDVKASGNYALLDMVKALEWVKQNIVAFGGDASRVTIFGESAGSFGVNLLQASPLARGLFHRVIGESGANFGTGRTLALDAAEKEGLKLSASIADLRARPASDLLKTTSTFRPVVDKWFLPADVSTIFGKGQQNDVPVLAGYNQDEGTTLAPWTGNAVYFAGMLRQRYPAFADELLQIYPAANDEEAARSYYASFRDQSMGWQMRTWVRSAVKTGKSPAYLYYFTRVPPGADLKKYGAYHAAEIQYVFGNLNPRRQWEDADRELSAAMSDYWVNFATTGDPNRKGGLHWPKYDPRKDQSIVFGDHITVQPGVNRKALDLLDRIAAAAAAAQN